MMCDVMPTINENGNGFEDHESQLSGEGANVEDMLLNMLDERDNFIEKLRKCNEELECSKEQILELQKENENLENQISWSFPQDVIQLQKELLRMKENLVDRDEENSELKAERNNTRLLLEHLELLVARHERALRLTVVKRQSITPSGVSSEVEVLKALKSLFEHHKALDEKVRERLRSSQDRIKELEAELRSYRNESSVPKTLNGDKSSNGDVIMNRTCEKSVDTAMADINESYQRLSNDGLAKKSLGGEEVSEQMDDAINDGSAGNSVVASQDTQVNLRCKQSELAAMLQDLDNQLKIGQKELLRSHEQVERLKIELNDSEYNRQVQSDRLAVLEQKLIDSQIECSSAHEAFARSKTELSAKEAELKVLDEKVVSLHDKLIETSKCTKCQNESTLMLPLNGNDSTSSDLLCELEQLKEINKTLGEQLQEANEEIIRHVERDKLNDEHMKRLSTTVDNLLSESNDRLQLHLREKMASLNEKNKLNTDLDSIRQILEETQIERDKLFVESERWKRQHYELATELMMQVRGSRGRMNIMTEQGNTIGEGDWDKMEHSRVLSNVQQDTRTEWLVTDSDTNSSWIESTTDVSSPNSAAQTLAYIIQEQLDAINNEIFSIQEEQQNTELRAEELQSRVASPQVQHYSLSLYDQSPLGPSGWSPPGSPSRSHSSGHSTPTMHGCMQPHQNRSICYHTNPDQPMAQRHNQIQSRRLNFSPDSHYLPINNHSNTAQLTSYTQHNHLSEDIHRGSCTNCNLIDVPNASPCSTRRSYPATLNQYHIEPATHGPGQQMDPGTASRAHGSHNNLTLPYFTHNQGHNFTDINSLQASPNSCGSQESLQHHQRTMIFHPQMLQIPYSPSPSPSLLNKPINHIETTPVTKKKSRLASLSRIFKRGSNTKATVISSPIPANERLIPGYYHNNSNSHNPAPTYPIGQFLGVDDRINYLHQDQSVTVAASSPASVPDSPYNLGTIGTGLSNLSEDRRRKKKEELLEEVIVNEVPFCNWNGPTIVSWLELWVGMPAWYVAACRANVKSGAIMVALSESEIQREIGISNPLHRLKLRLAIQEMVQLTSPAPGPRPNKSLAFGELNHEWVGNFWLSYLGLSQYRAAFMECLVDARMLDHLSKKDLRVHLKMVDNFHRVSILYGVACLKKINYDRNLLQQQQEQTNIQDSNDVMLWSNEQVMSWLECIDLIEYAANIVDTGVHGALLVLDQHFRADQLALILRVPTNNDLVRQRLSRELDELIGRGRSSAPVATCTLDRPITTVDDGIVSLLPSSTVRTTAPGTSPDSEHNDPEMDSSPSPTQLTSSSS